jgi:glutaminyl-peptide cyclotransferase
VQRAPEVVRRVWETAVELGYGSVFRSQVGLAITDDHVPFLNKGYHVIDVIDLQYGPVAQSDPFANANPNYHHTMQDTFDKLSAKSLQTIGDVAVTLVK